MILKSFFYLIFLTLLSCNSQIYVEVVSKNDNKTNDSSKTTVFVDQTDDDNSIFGFGGGNHKGTSFTSGVLTLTNSTNFTEFAENWAPKYSNIIQYFNFNGVGTNLANSTSITAQIGTNATVVNNTTASIDYVPGRLNEAIEFTAENNYLEVSNFDPPHSGSISFWTKPTAFGTGDKRRILGGADGFEVVIMDTPQEGNLSNDFFQTGVSDQTNFPLLIGSWYHIVFSWDFGGTGSAKTYVNGTLYLNTNNADDDPGGPFTLSIGTRTGIGVDEDFEGLIDELAIWNVELSTNEVHLIYERQKAAFAGEMESRIIDSLNNNSSWTSIDWKTTLPFGKELPGQMGSEASQDYTSLVGSNGVVNDDDLMVGLVGLWTLNKKLVGNGPGGSDYEDFSVYNNHGVITDDTEMGHPGMFNNAPYFDGADDHIIISDPIGGELDFGTSQDFSISAWFKTTDSSGFVVSKYSCITSPAYGIEVKSSKLWTFLRDGIGVGVNEDVGVTSGPDVTDGKWHHVVAIYDRDGFLTQYLDGQEQGTTSLTTITDSIDNSEPLRIGRCADGSFGHYQGLIDEVAIWNRVLDVGEVLQLYRRGANRIKIQVRTCSSLDCTDQDSLQGDGWKGPGGNHFTYFSEVYNNNSILSNCVVAQGCFESEFDFDGDVNLESPSLQFDQFGADGIYLENHRFFQYKVILESDDENNSCNGGSNTCMPELESITIGPNHTYEN